MGAEELMVEAYLEAMQDAGVETSQIQAAWFATAIDEQHVGKGGTPLSVALRLPNIPVTRVENFCASGSEAFRGAVYAVAAGACDIALALGVEKLKDTGYGGLPQREQRHAHSAVGRQRFGAGQFRAARLRLSRQARRLEGRSQARHRACVGEEPRQRRQESQGASAEAITEEHVPQCADDRRAARPVRLLRRVGRRGLRHRHDAGNRACDGQEEPHHRQGAAAVAVERSGEPAQFLGRQLFPHARIASKRAYDEAGIKNPRNEISMMEVHDCFSVTELVTMEDLHISKEGEGWKDVMNGFYDADGQVPCQIDGGLKCFGHPIGASGLRMLYEMYLQLRAGRARAS